MHDIVDHIDHASSYIAAEPSTSDDATSATIINASQASKGRLKIYLGYCAGVGKTFRMLQEARVNRNNGAAVVIGLVETHGRKETETLLQDLEIMPRRTIQHGGLTISEMDLDAILARRPQLVIVDELAHTNIPGSRHTKRYQDVEELLNAGIDVYSTLNIQHVQSLTDIVQQITGIKVDEIIPDRILKLASEIELVDLPIEKLLQRLMEGKVYIPQKAKQAMQKFFKKGNLLALRELSLKYTAKRVDIDLLSYRAEEEISTIWPVESKLLVCLSSNKSMEKLLLIAHRMANDLKAEWYAAHVESPQQVHLSDKSRAQLYRNIHLAEELGAKTLTLSGNIIADALIKFAKEKNVTLIISGLSRRSRFDEFFKGSVLNRLVKKSSPINVLVVGGDDEQTQQPASHAPSRINYKVYFLSSLMILATTGLSWILSSLLNPTDLLMLYFIPLTIIGYLWGSSASIFAAFLAVAMINFFFVPPQFSFAVADVRYTYAFIAFLLITGIVNWFGRLIRWRTKSARYRERFTAALYNFGREMMMAESLDDISNRVVKNISEAFETDVMVLLPNQNGELEFTVKNKPELVLSDTEKAVAIWVYKNGMPAGRGTKTLSSAKWYYLPLKVNENTLGVICMIKVDIDKNFPPEQKRLLESFASIVAMSLAKSGLTGNAGKPNTKPT
jgi:two-component system, OmpR family, sensor histidine kinase KdpD